MYSAVLNKNIFKTIDEVLSGFLWNNKAPRIRKSLLQNVQLYYWSSHIQKITYWLNFADMVPFNPSGFTDNPVVWSTLRISNSCQLPLEHLYWETSTGKEGRYCIIHVLIPAIKKWILKNKKAGRLFQDQWMIPGGEGSAEEGLERGQSRPDWDSSTGGRSFCLKLWETAGCCSRFQEWRRGTVGGLGLTDVIWIES